MGADADGPPVDLHRAGREIDVAAEQPLGADEKVLRIVGRVETDVVRAEQPAQHRARPGEDAKGGRVGEDQEIRGAFHLRHADAPARRESGVDRLVRGILEQHRGADGDAAFQRRLERAGGDRLAAQDAVLVGEGKSNDFDSLAFYFLQYFLHAALAAQGARPRRAASASL